MRRFGFLFLTLLLVTAPTAWAQEDTNTGTTPGKQRCDACGTDPTGQGICFEAESCAVLMPCVTNADCPAGRACLVDNCCAAPKDKSCALLCDDPACSNPGTCGGYKDCEPLLVTLASFEADYEDGKVQLTWTTSSEIDNAGFRVLKLRPGRGRYAKDGRVVHAVLDIVTPSLIPAAGTELSGASYKYVDGTRQSPGVVYYYLEDIDYLGAATLHGPVIVDIPQVRKRSHSR